VAHEIGIEILTVEERQELQESGKFDVKTSGWVITPPEVREPYAHCFATAVITGFLSIATGLTRITASVVFVVRLHIN
jgi:hypothetical protein